MNALRLVASTPEPEPSRPPRIQFVSDCDGARWVASPARNTVYVLVGPPEQVGRAVTEAMAALAAVRRPRLATAGGVR